MRQRSASAVAPASPAKCDSACGLNTLSRTECVLVLRFVDSSAQHKFLAPGPGTFEGLKVRRQF